jgi:microcystin-dependent protein
MAGTIPLSMTQQFDPLGDPLSGGLLYFFVAGTVSTPQNAFKDIALTQPWPNPITLDVAGRVPQVFLADGLIKIRLTDNAGVVQLSADNIQVIGASSGGGGGGGSVDATTIFQTGDIKKRYGVGIHAGWVRANARTIGNSASGATELADSLLANALFQYLWNTDPNLVVIGGRGSTSLADWDAGKQMTLPDGRGTAFAGMDDMGNTAANRLTASYFGANATVLGARGGAQSNTLTGFQLGSHAHGATIFDPGHTHNLLRDASPVSAVSFVDDGGTGLPTTGGTGRTNSTNHSLSIIEGYTGVRIWDGTTLDQTAGAGGNQPHANVQPTMVVTFYLKL